MANVSHFVVQLIKFVLNFGEESIQFDLFDTKFGVEKLNKTIKDLHKQHKWSYNLVWCEWTGCAVNKQHTLFPKTTEIIHVGQMERNQKKSFPFLSGWTINSTIKRFTKIFFLFLSLFDFCFLLETFKLSHFSCVQKCILYLRLIDITFLCAYLTQRIT